MAFGFRSRILVVGLAAVTIAGCGGQTVNTQGLSPDAKAGAQIASGNCLSCHSLNGSDGAGPTWKGLAGSQVKLSDGTTVTADDAYLTQSIEDPDAQIVSGYHQGVMASAIPKGSLKPTQVRQLVAYIDSLKPSS
jgi:cytochrome c oxidase subunit II